MSDRLKRVVIDQGGEVWHKDDPAVKVAWGPFTEYVLVPADLGEVETGEGISAVVRGAFGPIAILFRDYTFRHAMRNAKAWLALAEAIAEHEQAEGGAP